MQNPFRSVRIAVCSLPERAFNLRDVYAETTLEIMQLCCCQRAVLLLCSPCLGANAGQAPAGI